ncbi:PREDICTED: protocadherin-12 [Nanorana parkeri]|uniref:protocadherin-12 n=1 Tax=Nanorana parkeri TaxID=125878 RepID=UPI000855055B|nr:PREDICTED: protocadherin-12 [Nanorana parkeri]
MARTMKVIRQVFSLLFIYCFHRSFQNSVSLMVRFRIQEEVSLGTVIGRISDASGWTEDANEEYKLIQETNTFPVQVGLKNGSISTTGRLDRESLCHVHGRCILSFNVLATKALALVHVEIEILDINDNEPMFPKAELDVEISESASLRTRIPLDRAWDPDSGSNAVKLYTLSPNEHFTLEIISGSDGVKHPELVVVKELDRELQSTFSLVLTALDGGYPPKSGITQVRINVLDSNDNSPIFEESSIILEVSEDTSPGTILINLTATDPDQGPNGEIEFSFSKHTPHHVLSMFSIDPKLGEIVLKQPLDYESRHSYEIDVQAKDLGPNPIPTHCKVVIKVLDINDNTPDIKVTWATQDSPEIIVSEAVPLGSFVALVMANDPDSGSNGDAHCHLIQDHEHFRLQKAKGNSYILTTNAILDREKWEVYDITIQAQDQGKPSFTAKKSLKIFVRDANDNAPIFQRPIYDVSLYENRGPPTHLLTVNAQDVDFGENAEVTYKIIDSVISGTPLSTFFSVQSKTGEIVVLKAIDYEEIKEIQFFVQAEDNGDPRLSSNASVKVLVRDQNDNSPLIVQPQLKRGHASITILVNAESGFFLSASEVTNSEALGYTSDEILSETAKLNKHPIFQVIATDADSDENAKLLYHLLDDYQGLFAMDEHLGYIYINSSNASNLIGSVMDLQVTVRDCGIPYQETKAQLTIMFTSHLDHLKNSASETNNKLSLSVVIVICLSVLLVVCLLILALIMSFCRVDRKDNRAYNCREEESAYRKQPRRPQRQIQKADIHVVPVLRGRQQPQPVTPVEEAKLFPMPDEGQEVPEDQTLHTPFHLTPRLYRTLRHHHNQEILSEDTTDLEQSFSLPASVCRTLQYQRQRSYSRENFEDYNGTLPFSNKTLKNPGSPQIRVHDNVSSSEPMIFNEESFSPATSLTLRRQKNAEQSSKEQILRSLVRLSMVALAEKEAVELTMQSPHVQQISQLLSMLHQGQVHPKTLHRGNKYSSKSGRTGGQETDGQSTKDSGHGESEAGDLDSESGGDFSTSHNFLEDNLETLLGPHAGSKGNRLSDLDPGWIARLSLPLANSYKENIFTPNDQITLEPPITASEKEDLRTFLTFGKASDGSQDNRLASTFLSEMSTLFEMLLTQKAESHGDTASEVLMRLSACSKSMDSRNDGTRN